MDNNAIVYSLYCEYTGRKESLLDTAVLAKASTTQLAEDEKVYALISIVRLYALANYKPNVEDVSTTKLSLVRKLDKSIFQLELSKFNTKRDKAEELIKAISVQEKYANVSDVKLAVMHDLREYYDKAKDFDSLLSNALNGEKVDKSTLTKTIKVYKDYIDKYFASDLEDDNLVNIIYSEVVEDLEEILSAKK